MHKKNSIELNDVKSSSVFGAVGALLYNSHIADALISREQFFCYASMVAQTTKLHKLFRSESLSNIELLVNIVEREML